jgi:glucosyl-3-phosphoglycerate synthase
VTAKNGCQISVVLPARDEALTIGPIVTTIQQILVERAPLVDELIVMDGGSTDETARIAAESGARVVMQGEVLPDLPAGGGKGDALWRSLFVSRGDIVVWVDTDIRNFHPRFVYGLVGPLLAEPSIQYVKAFYERPLAEEERLVRGAGGRVTELVARPLINLFWPELAGLIQPLSGEYAGRRELLERIPFSTGYGVELGMLVDVLDAVGIKAIAQVDLETREHRNQDIASLSRMSFGIIQAALARLRRSKRLTMKGELPTTLLQFRSDNGGTYEEETVEISVEERPPAVSVPQYRKR